MQPKGDITRLLNLKVSYYADIPFIIHAKLPCGTSFSISLRIITDQTGQQLGKVYETKCSLLWLLCMLAPVVALRNQHFS